MFENTKIIGREKNWRSRKMHEACEIFKDGKNVISTPSFDVDPIWFTLVRNFDNKKNGERVIEAPKIRRSARLQEKARVKTAAAVGSLAQLSFSGRVKTRQGRRADSSGITKP
jgi:hypothetical protein